MDAGLIVVLIVVVLVLIVVLWAVGTYNGFVKLRNLVQEAWRQIDVELHRRYDLIPNLIETVKGYAAHERSVFDEVTRARAAAATPGATPAQQAIQEDQLSNAIGRLFAVAEAYPQLRAAENFTQLQNELTNTEDRIAAGRRFYNANVRDLNTKVETFPPNIIANMFKFSRAEYFEVTDPAVRTAPRVSFQDTQGNVGTYNQNAPAAQPRPTDSPVQPGTQQGGPGQYQPNSYQPGQPFQQGPGQGGQYPGQGGQYPGQGGPPPQQ